MNVFQGVHPDDLARVIQVFQDGLQAQHAVFVTYRFQHKAGHWVWLESTGTNATDNPDLRGVVINTRDGCCSGRWRSPGRAHTVGHGNLP